MIKHILVPVDGSAYARQAVELACDLAGQLSADLTLLHVMARLGLTQIPPELREYARLEHVEITSQDLLRGSAERILEDMAQLARSHGVEPQEGVIEAGDPARRITDYAAAHDIDLIVMGNRGLSDLGGLLLGSVSHKVAHLAHCPCLLAR